MHTSFNFGLIVDSVKANNTLQEDMKFRMLTRVFGDFEQRLENICGTMIHIQKKERRRYILRTTSSKLRTEPLAL